MGKNKKANRTTNRNMNIKIRKEENNNDERRQMGGTIKTQKRTRNNINKEEKVSTVVAHPGVVKLCGSHPIKVVTRKPKTTSEIRLNNIPKNVSALITRPPTVSLKTAMADRP